MKKMSVMLPVIMALVMAAAMPVHAKEDKIQTGIYVNDMNLSGMTIEEARQTVQSYVDSFGGSQITLHAVEEGTIVTTASELGLKWGNEGILQEAARFGRDGDILQCYKELKDLEYQNKVYDVAFDFDKDKIRALIEENGAQYNQEAVNASLVKTETGFQVVEGQPGILIDTAVSTDAVYDYLLNEWNGGACDIDLAVTVDEPAGTAEELAKVKDVLGTFTTSYSSSNSNRSANVANGCELINGTLLYPGDEFSTYEAVAPFSVANGYFMAGSYLNGKVVDSLGGGICQVSTTLYNTVLLAELEVTERHNHSMIVTYVDPSADAAIAESSGKDFKFVNNLDYPIYIEGYTENKKITFTIYGAETRDAGREVRYESEVLEVINPPSDTLYPDPGQPIGYVVKSGAHIGYKARLWKVVTENGTEVERTQVNSSSYKMVPRSATIGTATADPVAYEEIMAAIGTGSLDHVMNVIALLTQPPQPEQPEVPVQ